MTELGRPRRDGGSRRTMGSVRWRLHLASPPERVYAALATDEGRARFWAESSREADGAVGFVFPNGATWRGRIVEASPPERFAIEYYGGTITTFELRPDGRGGNGSGPGRPGRG